MKSRSTKILGVTAAAAVLVTLLFFAADALAPEPGLRRYTFTQRGFAGTPIEDHTSSINLDFLNEHPELPRQFFSVRWRGFLFLREPQAIEFFAGGNDEVELRIDDQVLLRRNLSVGLRTVGRTVTLSAGSHALAVDYQQFGGGMALNIQRAIAGGTPGPFTREELFIGSVTGLQAWIARTSDWLRRAIPITWLVFALTLVMVTSPTALRRWRTDGAPRNARDYARRTLPIAAVALLGPTVVFLLGPHRIFTNNTAEFAVPYRELAAPWLLRTTAINSLLLFGVGGVIAIVSQRLAQMYVALLFAWGLLLWGQGNLWNANYGVLTGQNIDLSVHAWRSPYELAAWATALLIALVFFRHVSRIAPFASLVFLGAQAVAGAFTATRAGATVQTLWVEPPANIYRFSQTRNVIHIVLDEFQADVFNAIFESDRAALDRQFSGFQYFADHAGSFPTTTFAMPAMLAAREYRNEKPAPEFVREAFKDSSVFAAVAKAGFDVDAMSIVPLDSFEQWMGTDASPNWKGSRFRIRKPFVSRRDYREVSARQLLELSLFRHVPHAAKAISIEHADAFYRPIWMDRTESPAQVRRHEASNSVAFLEQFIGSMGVGRERPVYKLIHVGAPHRPIVVDRECRFIGLTDMSRESYTAQSRCAVKLVAALLDRARGLGIYDSSLIIVSSDHGTDLDPLGFAGKSESLSLIPGPSTVRLPAIASTAKAVMLIKLPDRNGPMTVSQAPTSHVDLPSTIVDALGLGGASAEGLMFQRNPQQPRSRVFGMYNPFIRFPKEYVDRVDVLTLDGRVLDAAAWNVQRLIWRPDLRLDDREVDFGPRSGNYYLGPGWSLERRETVDGSLVTFAQALTKRAVISASLPARTVELVLRASSPPGSGPRTIRVDVDGRETPPVTLSGRDGYNDLRIAIPPDSARPSVSAITLHFDTGGREDFVFNVDRMVVR